MLVEEVFTKADAAGGKESAANGSPGAETAVVAGAPKFPLWFWLIEGSTVEVGP